MPCTLDIEASGFGRASYPIEIGYVRDDGQSGCSLILPQPDWTHWDEGAARLHGIDRATLQRHGRPAADVALVLNRALTGQTVYCDGWAHDYVWLAVLYDAADMVPAFRLESAATLLKGQALHRLGEAQTQARTTLGPQRHRASADARVLRHALLALGAT